MRNLQGFLDESLNNDQLIEAIMNLHSIDNPSQNINESELDSFKEDSELNNLFDSVLKGRGVEEDKILISDNMSKGDFLDKNKNIGSPNALNLKEKKRLENPNKKSLYVELPIGGCRMTNRDSKKKSRGYSKFVSYSIKKDQKKINEDINHPSIKMKEMFKKRDYRATTQKVIEDLERWIKLSTIHSRKKTKNMKKKIHQKRAAQILKMNYHTLKCNRSIYLQAKRLQINLEPFLNESFGKVRKIVKKKLIEAKNGHFHKEILI